MNRCWECMEWVKVDELGRCEDCYGLLSWETYNEMVIRHLMNQDLMELVVKRYHQPPMVK